MSENVLNTSKTLLYLLLLNESRTPTVIMYLNEYIFRIFEALCYFSFHLRIDYLKIIIIIFFKYFICQSWFLAQTNITV